MYFVVYRNKEVIDGPYTRAHANDIKEDLGMLFEDSHYAVLEEKELTLRGLPIVCRHHIHEDMPAV